MSNTLGYPYERSEVLEKFFLVDSQGCQMGDQNPIACTFSCRSTLMFFLHLVMHIMNFVLTSMLTHNSTNDPTLCPTYFVHQLRNYEYHYLKMKITQSSLLYVIKSSWSGLLIKHNGLDNQVKIFIYKIKQQRDAPPTP